MDVSIEVGGGSCGGEICGVIKAGSLSPFLGSIPLVGLSSREDVPAGVSGGDCTAWVIDERCWEDWPDCVREAGEGDGACSSQWPARRHSKKKSCAYSRGWQRDGLKGEVLHALRLDARLLQCRREAAQLLLGLRTQWLFRRCLTRACKACHMLEGVFGLNLLVDIAEADGLRRQLLCSWRRHDGTGVGIVEERCKGNQLL